MNGTAGQGRGRVSRVPSIQPTGVPLPCLPPGPTRDMQPTMKFVMDTSKYWFKPSITREQGKRAALCFRERTRDLGIGPASGTHIRQMGPWGPAGEGTASGRSRAGGMSWGPHDLKE